MKGCKPELIWIGPGRAAGLSMALYQSGLEIEWSAPMLFDRAQQNQIGGMVAEICKRSHVFPGFREEYLANEPLYALRVDNFHGLLNAGLGPIGSVVAFSVIPLERFAQPDDDKLAEVPRILSHPVVSDGQGGVQYAPTSRTADGKSGSGASEILQHLL